MENKELGLLEIKERIKVNRTLLDPNLHFKRTPSTPIMEKDLPCIIMMEDVDSILKKSSRSTTGYPARRLAEIPIEIVTERTIDIKQLYLKVRKVIFTDRNTLEYSSLLARDVFINENRTEGPTGYGLPDILGMRLILDLIYTDEGF